MEYFVFFKTNAKKVMILLFFSKRSRLYLLIKLKLNKLFIRTIVMCKEMWSKFFSMEARINVGSNITDNIMKIINVLDCCTNSDRLPKTIQ